MSNENKTFVQKQAKIGDNILQGKLDKFSTKELNVVYRYLGIGGFEPPQFYREIAEIEGVSLKYVERVIGRACRGTLGRANLVSLEKSTMDLDSEYEELFKSLDTATARAIRRGLRHPSLEILRNMSDKEILGIKNIGVRGLQKIRAVAGCN